MTEIISVQSVTQGGAPDTFIVVASYVLDGQMFEGAPVSVLPDDPYGIAPALRGWMADHAGEFTIHPHVEPATEAYRIAKTTPWLRMTDAEGALVDAALNAAPARLRAIYQAASYLSSGDPLWQTMHDILAATLSPARADVLLAAEA